MNDIYNNFIKQYNKLHSCCPNCGSRNYESTLLCFAFDENHPEEYKDKNRCTCMKCGWKGIHDDLAPNEKDYPKPYYININTESENKYCKVSDNFMFKENGEWKHGLILYKTMFWNPDGEYFARTKEDFENNFEEIQL